MAVAWNRGQPLTPEHRAHITAAKLGHPVSAATRERLARAGRARRLYGEDLTRTLCFRVSPAVYEALETQAEERGVSISERARQILRDGVRRG